MAEKSQKWFQVTINQLYINLNIELQLPALKSCVLYDLAFLGEMSPMQCSQCHIIRTDTMSETFY